MNQNLKIVLSFTLGAAVGSVATWFGVKKYYEMRADLEVESVVKAYTDKLEDIEYGVNSVEGDIEGPEEIPTEQKKSYSSIIERLNNKPDLLDYTKYFHSDGKKLDGVNEALRDAKEEAIKTGMPKEELEKMEEEFAENETPEDDIPYSDEEDREEQLKYEDYQLNGEHKKALEEDREPYEIDPSDFELTCSNYEKMSLVYNIHTGLVTNEEGEEVDERLFLGDVIDEAGFAHSDQLTLYVRNDVQMIDIELTKSFERE